MNEIPMLDGNDKDLIKKLEFELDAIDGSTSWDNSRERPYNGQPWTDSGQRGAQEVKGITMRDLCDCLVQGFLASSDPDQKLQDKTFALSKNEEWYKKGDWRYNDLYKIDLDKVDPRAVIQNFSCFVEKYMGIFPNFFISSSDD